MTALPETTRRFGGAFLVNRLMRGIIALSALRSTKLTNASSNDLVSETGGREWRSHVCSDSAAYSIGFSSAWSMTMTEIVRFCLTSFSPSSRWTASNAVMPLGSLALTSCSAPDWLVLDGWLC
jgi:hypothetical protein